MRNARILAISADAAMAERLARILDTTGGVVEIVSVRDALAPRTLDCSLCVLHLAGALADSARAITGRLGHGARIVYVVPRADLASTVELVALSEVALGVISVDGIEDMHLAALVRRAITHDVFGLAKAVPEAAIERRAIRDFADRSRCLAELADYAAQHGVVARVQTAIEECADEMLMNALYDAPVDVDGVHIFADVPVATRVRERIDQEAVVEFAYDGKQLAIAVRDAYGSLDRASVLRSLLKCLHAPDTIDRKAGGAGVGLFLMATQATTLSFHVIPGLATEVICTFDARADQPRLAKFAVVVEREDVTGALVSGRRPANQMRRISVEPAPDRKTRRLAIATGITVAIAVAAVASTWLRDKGKPARPVPATVSIDSTPPGAAVQINGTFVGDTPVSVTTLAPSTDVDAKLSLRGYEESTVRIHVPARGQVAKHVQPLALSPKFVRVRFHSTPPGARIVRMGASNLERTYTPADVFVEANQPQNFVVTMPGHDPLVIEAFTAPAGSPPLEKGGELRATPDPE